MGISTSRHGDKEEFYDRMVNEREEAELDKKLENDWLEQADRAELEEARRQWQKQEKEEEERLRTDWREQRDKRRQRGQRG